MTHDLQARIIADIAEVKNLLIQQKTVFNPKEAAAYIGCALSTIYKLTSAGVVPFAKPNGKKIYFSKKALDEFLLSNPTTSGRQKEIEAATFVATH